MPQVMPLSDRISQSSSRTQKERAKEAQFGGGYKQRVADGTNSKFGLWAITYENLDEAERAVVVPVLDAVGTTDYLTWTAHGDSTEKRWRITDDGYSESWTSGIHSTITFNVEQYF